MRKFVIGFVLLLLTGCMSKQPYEKVRLKPVGETAPTKTVNTSRLPLRVAIAAIVSPQSTMRSYADLVAYLGERMG